MIKLFLHVGFPKTGSSTLQKHLFAEHPGLNYLGRPLSGLLADLERDILTLDDQRFEARLPGYQERLRAELGVLDERPVLLSHEGFLRQTRYGGHDLAMTAKRLRRVFLEGLGDQAQVQVLVTVRNQADWILSHFVQFVKGRQSDLDRHLATGLLEPNSGVFAGLFYDELLARYAALFGAENLHVLIFEQLVRDRQRFVERLSAILDIDSRSALDLLSGHHEKKRPKQAGAYLVRDKKSLWHRAGKGLRRLGLTALAEWVARESLTPVVLSGPQLRGIGQLYGASNGRLETYYGLPLRDYGYPMDEGLAHIEESGRLDRQAGSRRDAPRGLTGP